jgi:cell fate regulator YaaT (PSP1 superfamily)
MAKEQDLPLNPLKISGVCGRLLCCLSYESELYRALKANLPKVGQKVTTPMGAASVVSVNPLKETVLVALESETTVELPSRDVSPASS